MSVGTFVHAKCSGSPLRVFQNPIAIGESSAMFFASLMVLEHP